MIIFGLTGGIGNALFALPTIKRFSRAADVSLVVDCDYEARALFRRCSFIRKVYGQGDKIGKATRYIAAYGVPASMRGLPVEFVGWSRGTSVYPHPEWQQIKMKSGCGDAFEDVTDWCDGLKPEKRIDFALLPCGKPGEEWSRKKWNGFLALAQALELKGHTVQAFGQAEEIREAGLIKWWEGAQRLEAMPDALARCRVAVSNDCGPGHLASSIGVPTVMIFMATSPVKGRMVGPGRIIATGCKTTPTGCQSTPLWQACTNWICQKVNVERVLAESLEMLDKK
jgi:ADP-heptose:LPS heptosyltransferase